MKTHPHLLVRDALAERFVAACSGDEAAGETLADLAHWADGAESAPRLTALRTEDGEPLFDGLQLASRFAALDAWARDRARRYRAALAWIRTDGCTGEPVECARAAWDAGLFFEVHEILEPVWVEAEGARREALQGLIMAGAALHHLTEGNRAGARGLARESARRLRAEPDALPIDSDELAHGLDALADGIDAGDIRIASDLREPPRLKSWRARPNKT